MRAAASFLMCAALAAAAVVLGAVAPAQAADVNVDLWTRSATMTMPGGSVMVWGYSSDNSAITKPGGPTLRVTRGQTVQVTLHNQTGEDSGLVFQGQDMPTDRTGVATGSTKVYTFTASRAGTFLYEAGLTPNAQHQVAMGLYGALVVDPGAPGRAYATTDTDRDTSYDTEAVLVLSEIDPALSSTTSTLAAKQAFDLRTFNPRYFLINGQPYPNTQALTATPGQRVLLRYVNAGLNQRSMGVLGAHQTVVGLDGNPLRYARRYVAETFGPGQTADAIVTAPSAPSASQLTILDNSLALHNSGTSGIGGMLTTVDVSAATTTSDTAGPGTRDAAFTSGSLTATVDDTATGGGNVTAAEYFLDSVGAPGSGTSMTGTFGTTSVTVSTIATVGTGEHVLYVRGRDASSWGPLTSVLVDGGDAGGPVTKAPSLTPRLTNHSSTGVAVHATADDTATGNSPITAAEYFIDKTTPPAVSERGCAMVVNNAAPVASVDATIPAVLPAGPGPADCPTSLNYALSELPEGNHSISIRSKDPSTWGELVSLDLTIDTTGPDSSGVTIAPNPTNGLTPFTNGTPSIRVMSQTLSDPVSGSVNSTIKRAEAFLDTVGANGTGIPLIASDGVFNDASEGGYADIPLSTVQQLSQGNHPVRVHAMDEAGNWGPLSPTVDLVVDRTGPTASALALNPSTTTGAPFTVALTATATDTQSAIAAAEWFVGADPGVGNGTAMTVSSTGATTASLGGTINTRALGEGTRTVQVRVKDAAGTWGPLASTTLVVRAQLWFSTLGSTLPAAGVGGTADDSDVYRWTGTLFNRMWDATASGVPASANVDGLDRVDGAGTFADSHFYLSFSNTSTTLPTLGTNTVQDEDVVYYNGGAWSLWFDGSQHGLGGNNNLDLDAISVSGSALYFSTTGATVPGNAGGTADAADIYRYDGSGNSYTRIWDASANGVPAGANVDGLVRVDDTHFYLSFSNTTVTLPGVGTVQDEDVVYYDNGTWSVYFDGTGKGLTAGNLDVDAFDVQ